MKHYGDIVSKEIVTNLVRRLAYVKCDNCGKIIKADAFDDDSTRYIKVHTWHNDWGNDSVYSHEYFDLCPECAIKFVSEYVKEMRGTHEIECSAEHAWRGEKNRTVSRKDGYEP